jgi:hypothetical protein
MALPSSETLWFLYFIFYPRRCTKSKRQVVLNVIYRRQNLLEFIRKTFDLGELKLISPNIIYSWMSVPNCINIIRTVLEIKLPDGQVFFTRKERVRVRKVSSSFLISLILNSIRYILVLFSWNCTCGSFTKNPVYERFRCLEMISNCNKPDGLHEISSSNIRK